MSRRGAWVSRALLLGSACMVAACAALFSNGRPRRSNDEIRISHAKHKAGGVECISCHEDVYDAKNLEGRVLPKEAKCLECHGERKEKGECNFCHLDPKHPATYPPREVRLRLSHTKHIELVKEDCARCHKTLPEFARSLAATAPMRECFQCHDHDKEYREGRCESCHVDLAHYALKPVSLFSHQGNWVRSHSKQVRTSAASCAQCHEQTFCGDCHARTVATRIEVKFPERVEQHFIHRNDFIGRHSIEARGDSAGCRRCHGSSFCESCHQAQNLTPFGQNPRSPHPPGYAFPGAPNSHDEAARRDIGACASCHDQGANSICVDCHKVGGVGGNPHPRNGWTNRHPREEIRQNAMCGYCHI